VVVFTDIRNRATPGWLEGIVAPLADPANVVAGGHVDIGGNGRLAHRIARDDNHLDPEPLLRDDFLPFVTTSSMAVRRSALEAVDGFMEVRSGADADLCWRVQLAGLGAVVLAPASRMTCEPRSGLLDVYKQWRRYATSYVELRTRYEDEGAMLRPTFSIRERLRLRLERDTRRSVRVELADAVRWGGYEIVYRREVERSGRALAR
jgi:hypothetical protein